jgi:hypothetical protein
MVMRRLRARRGASTFGCLLMLALLGAAAYYGYHIGAIYLRYYELLDDMRQQARLGAQVSDDTIQVHLAAQADSLLHLVPDFRIHRGGRPSRITIQTEYSEQVDLPFFKHTFTLRPRAEEPL